MPNDMKTLAARLAVTKILVVDDERFMRNVIHALLVAMGADKIYEAANGTLGLDLMSTLAPDLVILDWEMPGVDGPAFMRTVRSPGKFPHPDVPIIMLTGHGERSRVAEALQLGINEFLVKPVSRTSLEDRITAVLTKPRPMIRNGNYYGPAPRKLSAVINDPERPIDDYFLVD
jgi:CheY-like chemotaxis protein